MKRIFALSLLALALTACDKPAESTASGQCAKDTDCKGDRICESGQCISPSAQASLTTKPQPAIAAVPAAPSVAYQAVIASGDEVGPFTVNGNQINYVSRAGVMDIASEAIEDATDAMFIGIDKAYSFGPDRYVLIISAGTGGTACPASTYAVSFDARGEAVDGKVSIDGCGESVDSLADGNKLIVKKEGAATTIYNGIIN